MKFLIHTKDGMVVNDFSFTLLESIRYQNWLRNDNEFEYKLTNEELFPGYIPVGPVPFVLDYLKKYYDLGFRPINIPTELFTDKFLKRKIVLGKKEDIDGIKFVKSASTIKCFTEIVGPRVNEIPDDEYLISDVVPIDSEWRAFVYNGKLVGLQNYSGEFTIFPDVNLINEMIRTYKDSPPAYTLDVAINDMGTFVIEVHDFFSCGLYGFSDHRYLPFMFSRWFNWFLQKNNKQF